MATAIPDRSKVLNGLETLVIGVANVVATVVKFVAMRSWIFADRGVLGAPPPAEHPTAEDESAGRELEAAR